MMRCVVLFLMGVQGACVVSTDDGDSGIFYPNPKAAPATFRLATGAPMDSFITVNGATVPNLSSLTFKSCEGETETMEFNQPLLTSQPESMLVFESEALQCAEEITIDATDIPEVAALVVSVTYNKGTEKERTVRLNCPADICFPMTFQGLLELPNEEELEEGQATALEWNALTDLSFLAALEQVQDDAFQDLDAGDCDGLSVCEDMERIMTREALILYSLPGEDFGVIGMTSAAGE